MSNSNSLTDDELNVIDLYFNKKKSIREIARLRGSGRTSVTNIINKYGNMSDENARELAIRKKLDLENRRNVETSNVKNKIPLTEKQIKKMHSEIISRKKSLTALSEETGKHRDTIKRAIIQYLNDDRKIKQFEEVLKENRSLTQVKYFVNYDNKKFNELPEEIKKQRIFEKLRPRRRVTGRKPDSEDLLEERYNRLTQFFITRNDKIENEEDKISDEEIQKMMYDTPKLLTLSLENKVKPSVDMLDSEFGISNTSYILKENSVIIASSLIRTLLQIKILKDTNTTKYVLEKPRAFRISPEFMYALIKHWELNGKSSTPFIDTEKLYRMYGETSKSLQEKYNIKDEYGDNEYFDGR